jgi:phosphomannomutase
VRASNTQPALVVRCEARDRQARDEIQQTIKEHVARARTSA